VSHGSPSHAVGIRPATAGDLARIVEIFEFGSLVEGKEDPNDLSPYEAALVDIAGGPGAVLVAEAEADGEVVGVCQLIIFRHLQARGGLCAEVESVHVHPGWRGRGIGRLLLQAALQRARDLGCYRLQLTSNQARPAAHRFYESLGLEPSHLGFKLPLQ
jgi:GNAT superfamily N-acetyltransferase